MTQYLFALGTNQPIDGSDLASTVAAAIDLLNQEYRISVNNVSQMYNTPAWPPGNGPDYVNAAAVLLSDLTPQEMLQVFHKVEAQLGRQRPVRWAPRIIDIDLLAAGDSVVPDNETVRRWMELPAESAALKAPDQLILPHPRMHERAFVLVPLQDVALTWRHPVLGLSVAEMAANLPPEDLQGITPLA